MTGDKKARSPGEALAGRSASTTQLGKRAALRSNIKITRRPQCQMIHLHLCLAVVATNTSTVLVTEIGEPPDVTEADRIRQAREDELELAAPAAAGVAAAVRGDLRRRRQVGVRNGVRLRGATILKNKKNKACVQWITTTKVKNNILMP